MKKASQMLNKEVVGGQSCGRGYNTRGPNKMIVALVAVATGTLFCLGAVHAQNPVPLGPSYVQVQVQFISIPKPEADAVIRAEADGIPSKDKILDLVKQGKANIICAPSVITVSGQEAMVKAVEECVYPTSWTTSTNITSAGTPKFLVVGPAKFETREVGVILCCMPEVNPNGDIHITMSPHFVGKPTWKVYKMKCFTPDGKEKEVDFEQPFFQNQSLSTSLVVKNGATVVAGGGLPDPNGQAFIFLLVTARLVDSSGDSRSKKDRVEPATKVNVTKRTAP